MNPSASSFSPCGKPLGSIVLHSFDCAASHGPKIEARHAAERREPPPVFFEELAGDSTVMVDHTQPALDAEIAVTQYVRPLHGKQHQHLRAPYAYAV